MLAMMNGIWQLRRQRSGKMRQAVISVVMMLMVSLSFGYEWSETFKESDNTMTITVDSKRFDYSERLAFFDSFAGYLEKMFTKRGFKFEYSFDTDTTEGLLEMLGKFSRPIWKDVIDDLKNNRINFIQQTYQFYDDEVSVGCSAYTWLYCGGDKWVVFIVEGER